jgi:hypothetical protein
VFSLGNLSVYIKEGAREITEISALGSGNWNPQNSETEWQYLNLPCHGQLSNVMASYTCKLSPERIVSPLPTMPPTPSSENSISLDASLISRSNPTPTSVAAPPDDHDASAFVILAAVLGSIAFAVAFLWLMKRAFADPLLRQARRQRLVTGYLAPGSSTSSDSTSR